MFWRFGGYANISTIDNILDKPDFKLEDLLDDSDLIQELKQHNTKLIEYLREDKVLQKLLEYVVAPRLEPVATPDDDAKDDDEGKGKARLLPFSRPRASSRATEASDEEEQEKKRNRYAFVAAEILSSDTWSIYEALMENQAMIRQFWGFLKRPTPLDPLQANYFTKVNEALFDKKTEDMIELLKSIPDAVADLLRHVECPMIMDLLLKIIALDRTEGGQGIVEWLYSQDVIPTLLSFLGPEYNWVVQTAAGDFIKAIITISANASQNENQCIGPNELTRQLVSQPCIEQLIKYMLGGGNPLTVGVGIVIEVIRKNNSDYDPDVGTEANSVPSSRDPIYLGTLLRLFAQAVPDFMNLVMNAPAQKQRINSTFGDKIEPLGFDRFKTCELMAELLHCSNMGLLNEVGSEDLIATRDAERQRLRVEGKLTPVRGEEPPSSVEDLTLRMTHASPDEGRRLEVTNSSEDDGFEEVEHSGEMQEDTSHEFVKAEEEIAAAPASSFIDKDDDDFVDEPLTSPRLHVKELKEGDRSFDSDMMVAPLSPKKAKSAPVESPEPTQKADEPSLKTEDEKKDGGKDVSDEKADGEANLTADDKDSQKGEESDSSVIYTPSVSEPEQNTEPEDQSSSKPINERSSVALSPRPEDTPQPLFSKSSAAPEAPPPEAKPETDAPVIAETPQNPEVTETAEAPQPPAVPPRPQETAEEQEPGTESIIVARPIENNHEHETEPLNPVVGDYLKMQFVEYRVVPTILSYFFAYPWNNFLHNVVYDIVQQVFNGPMDRGYNPALTISLFEAADVTAAIINGQLASDESQTKFKTRMGYMGHLTLIAEEVVKFTDRHPPELLSETVLEKVMSQDWINYVEGVLAETRERDNAILGGVRPDVALGNRAGMSSNGLAAVGLSGLGSSMGLGGSSQGSSGSNALAEAGLNGGMDMNDGGNSIGPFAISAGPIGGISGFGSSSDEDDDEVEETDEDVNNEFRAYTDPLNHSSLAPPSLPPPPPPPPPPLNTPPSRARLQLAARLAMQKNNAAAASLAAGLRENGAAGDDEEEDQKHGREQLRDPFADDEDDEIDSDDGNDDPVNRTGSGAAPWSAGRGSWWRGMVTRRSGRDKFGADDDSEDDDDDDDDDEEFGDFAMPEVESAPPLSSRPGGIAGIGSENVILKPMPVHPPSVSALGTTGGPNQKSALGSLWAFAGQGFVTNATAKDETAAAATKDSKEGTEKEGTETEESAGVAKVVEAKGRKNIEDPDEEVVV